uniref:DDE_Tnp_1_7 domain-containing protein n=1 Tax=Strongyloides stercoralis TaxID=6248 RepID=A0A0K0DZ95_STRER
MYTKKATQNDPNEVAEVPMESESIGLDNLSTYNFSDYNTIDISNCSDFPESSNMAVFNDVCGDVLAKKKKRLLNLSCP